MENRNVKELRQIAKERKIKYYYKMRKDYLVRVINNTSSQRSILSWAVPRPVVQRPIPAPRPVVQRPVPAPRPVVPTIRVRIVPSTRVRIVPSTRVRIVPSTRVRIVPGLIPS